MSPPRYQDLCRLIDTVYPGSLDEFTSQVTTRGPDSETLLADDFRDSLAWPNAIKTHLKEVGEMAYHPDTRHSTIILHPIKHSKTGTLIVLRSRWTAQDGGIDRKVVSHFLRTGPGQLVKAKEPPSVCLENSLAFEQGTRDTIRTHKSEWMSAAESIVKVMKSHGFVDPVCGSIIANGRVSWAGQDTKSVVVEFDLSPTDNPFVEHSGSRLVHWRFPREKGSDQFQHFDSPMSSINSSPTRRG